MPDRYGDRDEDDEPPVVIDQSVVDFESRRLDRESIAARRREAEQRKRLSETRSTHAPLSRDQSNAVRQHRQQVTSTVDHRRRLQWIANCQLCNEYGYRSCGAVCDHVDRSRVHARGMAAVRAAMGWDDPSPPTSIVTANTQAAPAASQPPTEPPLPNPPPGDLEGSGGLSEPPEPEGW